jgi:hypothetical protein
MLFDPLKKKQDNTYTDCPVLYSKHLSFSYAKIKNIEKDLIIPERHGIVFLQTETAFNAFDLVVFLAEKQPIKNLLASTYSISRNSIESIIQLHDAGKIEQMTLLISDSMLKRNPGTIENLIAMSSTRANLQVKFAWNHSKVNLIQTHDEFYVIEGSGNWSNNAHFEQYIFVNDKEVFDFRKQMFENDKIKTYEQFN